MTAVSLVFLKNDLGKQFKKHLKYSYLINIFASITLFPKIWTYKWRWFISVYISTIRRVEAKYYFSNEHLCVGCMLSVVLIRTLSTGITLPNTVSVSVFTGPLVNPDAEWIRLQATHIQINRNTRLARLVTQVFIRQFTIINSVLLNELLISLNLSILI